MSKDKTLTSSWRYKINLTYLDTKKNRTKDIKNECLKYMIIDHNYEKNNMPIIYLTLLLDRQLLDHMILNKDNNLIILSLYKYDETSSSPIDMECFRRKFVYFLPDDVNKNNDIDYTDKTRDEHEDNTYRKISIGLICVDHINNNKKCMEINAKKVTMYSAVKSCIDHFKDVVIEPFDYNDRFDQLIMPAKDSVKSALKFLNDYRVFYSTPYRYYIDFNSAYLISSSGKAIPRKDEKYTSVIFDIKDLLEDESNDPGMIINKTKRNYRIVVSNLDSSLYDNSIISASKTIVRGISNNGNVSKVLDNISTWSKDKIENYRINNDNPHMLDNIVADINSNSVFINITKTGLDTDVVTMNKAYYISNIERYKKYDGKYLLSRKRELYILEDGSFNMSMILNLRKIAEDYQ